MEEAADQHESLAKSKLVLMVRRFPYVQFPCNSLHGYELCDTFWEGSLMAEKM